MGLIPTLAPCLQHSTATKPFLPSPPATEDEQFLYAGPQRIARLPVPHTPDLFPLLGQAGVSSSMMGEQLRKLEKGELTVKKAGKINLTEEERFLTGNSGI